MVQRVLNQIHLAKSLGMEPAVFLGERTFMEPQACEYGDNPYFFSPRGDNVWEYWFRQPGRYAFGARTVNGQPVRSLQVAYVEAVAENPIRSYGGAETRLQGRQAANALLGPNGSALLQPALLWRTPARCLRPSASEAAM